MGNPKQKWTGEEEEALLAGINKYGVGKWKAIHNDPEFHVVLINRNNIDLKDKWRNMTAAGQGSRERFRAPRPRTTRDVPVTPSVNVQTLASAPAPAPAPASAVKPESQADHVKDDAAKELPDSKNGPRYSEMIFDALSAEEPNGLDIGSIVTYIEQRTEVPQNFRRNLGSKLRKLCRQEKLEKVENLYRIKKDSSEANTINRKQNGTWQPLSTTHIKGSLEEAAKTAAFKVVEAEDKSIAVVEAYKEVERISKLADETELLQQLAEEIIERCARGEIVQVA